MLSALGLVLLEQKLHNAERYSDQFSDPNYKEELERSTTIIISLIVFLTNKD